MTMTMTMMMSQTPLIITCKGLIHSAWRTLWPNAMVCAADTHTPSSHLDLVLIVAGERDWIENVAHYSQQRCPVVVLSRHLHLHELQQAFRVGATGYVDILCSEQELALASQAVTQGALWVPPALLNRLMSVISEQTTPEHHHDPFSALSPREREVADAVCQGLSNKHVALQLAITERTVKLHLTSIFSKLNIKDRMQLLLLSRQ